MLIFAIFNLFHTRQSTKNTTKKRQLPYRAREARAHSYFRTYRSARMVLYIKKTCIIYMYVFFKLCLDTKYCVKLEHLVIFNANTECCFHYIITTNTYIITLS